MTTQAQRAFDRDAAKVVNDSSDVGQLHAMAKAAKEALDAEALQVLADEGYYSSTELKACEDDGIKAYVPVPKGNRQIEKKGRFSLKDFSYDPAADAYRCPAGELLRPIRASWALGDHMQLADIATVVHHLASDNELVLVINGDLHIVACNSLAALDQMPGVRIGQRQLRLAAVIQTS